MYLRRLDGIIAELWRWEAAYKEASSLSTNGWLNFRMDQRAAALEEARVHLRQAYALIGELPRIQ